MICDLSALERSIGGISGIIDPWCLHKEKLLLAIFRKEKSDV